MDPILERYQALEDKVRSYTPNLDARRLFDAFTFADTEHHGQLRKSGEPYIIHPLAVADIVADLGLDVDSVIAALLHDTIEDTDATHEEVAKRFGEPVAELVEGVTKLTRVQYVTKEEEQMENLRKMLMAMAHDIRVILIKICDRLHNMRTMEYQSPMKQREKSLETMEIYAPIAHRLGMQKLKWELEDLALRYLDPVGYKEIQEELSARSNRSRNRFFNDLYFSRARFVSRVFHRLLLNLGRPAGYADTDPRLLISLLSHSLLDKILDHLFRNLIIRDHTLPQRTHRNNISGRSSDHQSGFFSDRLDLIGIPVKRNDRRLL